MGVRPRIILFVGILVATCWLGYWIGYITARQPSIEHMSQEAANKRNSVDSKIYAAAHIDSDDDAIMPERKGKVESKLRVMNRFDMLGLHRSHDDHLHHDEADADQGEHHHHHHHHNDDDMFLNKMVEVSAKKQYKAEVPERSLVELGVSPSHGGQVTDARNVGVNNNPDDDENPSPHEASHHHHNKDDISFDKLGEVSTETHQVVDVPNRKLPVTVGDEAKYHKLINEKIDDESIVRPKMGQQNVQQPVQAIDKKILDNRDTNVLGERGYMDMKRMNGNIKYGLDVPEQENDLMTGNAAFNGPNLPLPREHMAEIKNAADQPLLDRPGINKDVLPAAKQNPVVQNVQRTQVKWDPEYYALVHGSKSNRVHGKIHENIKLIDDAVPKEAYTFTANSLPDDARLRPSIANGHVGTAIHSQEVFMNGLYNGRGGDSHRAVIPSTCSFNITETEPASSFTRTYTLNVAEGMYSERSVCTNYSLIQRIYAHRKYKHLLVAEVDLVRSEVESLLKLKVALNRWKRSYDITFLTKDSNMEEVSYKWGAVNAGETPTSGKPEVHMYYDHVPDVLVPPPGAPRTKWVFLTAIAHSQQAAYEAYQKGVQLAMSNDQLYMDHIEEWAGVWQSGRIDVVDNMKLSKAIYGSMYYILSSLPLESDPQWPFIGLSPTGLPFGDGDHADLDYLGHVFWDQETWMFPPVLMFYPKLAKIITDTRSRTMEAAAKNAVLNGRKGLMYPWETAFTGFEVCPDEKIAQQEVHISGDISLAIMQYLYATGDVSVLSTGTYSSIISGIADHWVSRLVYNETLDKYTILNVTGPDEHHDGVNNSAYTNAIAQRALEAPYEAMSLLGHRIDRWQHFAEQIYHPYDDVHKYHPEFDGYKIGTKVKQADVVLLGYPLQWEMPAMVHQNDLNIYAKATNLSGPAMTWSMFAIGWLQEGDSSKAAEFFNKNFQYIKNEFQVWHEVTVGKGATNFITGMGGFLQSVIFGYGGFRVQHDGLVLNPYLPPSTTELSFTGLDYQGSTFNYLIQDSEAMLTLTSRRSDAPPLTLYLENPEDIKPLSLNHVVRFARRKGIIKTGVPAANDGALR